MGRITPIEIPVTIKLARTSRALQIAAETGIFDLLQQIETVETDMGAILQRRADLECNIRDFVQKVEDRELDLTLQVISENEGSSQAAIDRLLKLKKNDDETYVQRVQELAEARNDLTQHEVEVEVMRRMHRSLVARMTSIGGYFNWLSVSKEATTVSRVLGADSL